MKEQAKQKLQELVDRFRYNLDVYKKSTYNETQVRREFIDPFFEALGWDVSNKQGFAEQYKEVVHEDAIKVGRSTRAPDYSFRIGGQRKFFVEAKKPAVNIKEDVSPSYQLRRYAWSAKLPLSVVTDFEEFSVFDCQIKPNPTDKPGVGRIAYYTFENYLDKFDEIDDVFSKEAVLKGSFDRYAQSTKGKKGTAEVDSEFLKEIESWRELLAKNIALRNPAVSIYELNYAVQKLLDRIIFLRICEDRGIEPYGQLQTKAESTDVYTHLLNHFKLAESKYNSGIFDFYADKITPTLSIDDRVLKTVIQSLYYPKSPYEFSVLGVEILGNVYEQFLGKVIRLTAGHQAKVETKPEVKKAGGVYYTPQYIVDYIVKNTVGKVVEGKKPEEIAEIKILDPACGSGSFLIGAYTYLLWYHLDWYTSNEPKKHKEAVFQVRENEWYLTTEEKKRILLNNIFGVDIDPQAVEVTKLSLLLKVLEHESRESIGQQVKLGLEGVLPNLEDNIKCGNSLIGPDFYGTGQQERLFDEEEMRRVNVFDWEDDVKGFGRIMKRGGFDCVIGNPPWGAEFTEKELQYLREKNKQIIVRMIDSFMYFVYQTSCKLNDKGHFGMILPDVILYQNDNIKLREYLLTNHSISRIVNLGNGIFGKVTRPSCIVIFHKERDDLAIRVINCSKDSPDIIESRINDETLFESIDQTVILNIPGKLLVTNSVNDYRILEKVKSKPNEILANLVDGDGIQRGVSPDLKEAFIVDGNIIKKYELEPFKLKKVLTGGKQVKRYYIGYKGNYLIYNTNKDDFSKIPNICAYIKQFKDRITCKEVIQKKHSMYALHRPRKERIFTKNKKILGVITEDEIIVALDENSFYATDGLYLFSPIEKINPCYLMGILNSRLFKFLYRLISLESGRVLAQVKPKIISQLPIRTIDFSNPEDVAKRDKLVSLVDNMLELQKKLREARMERDKELYERQIKVVDAQIDRLVYELYGLTEEEIKVVEGEI